MILRVFENNNVYAELLQMTPIFLFFDAREHAIWVAIAAVLFTRAVLLRKEQGCPIIISQVLTRLLMN